MRTCAVKPIIAATLLASVALGPGAARALELSGWVGGDYLRRDDVKEYRLLEDRLHLDLGILGQGNMGGPDGVIWRADLAYRLNRSSYRSATSRQSSLTYSGLLRVLDTPGSGLSLTAGAARSQADVTTNSTSSGGLTGHNVGASYQTRLTVRLPDRPTLILGGAYADSTNSGFGRPDNSLTTRSAEATLMHGASSFGYRARYEFNEQGGTNPVANFRTQRADLISNVTFSPSSQGQLSVQTFLRTPGNGSPLNLSLEDTQVQAFATAGKPELNLRAQYGYGHSVTSGASLGDQESISHGLSAVGGLILSPAWALRADLGLSATQDRLGATETSAAGQSAGVLASWSRNTEANQLGFGLGGRVALLEPVRGASQVGWGASGSGRYSAGAGDLRYSGAYNIDYNSSVNAIQGTDLRQQATVEASTTWLGRVFTRGSLLYSASRRHRELLGDSADRVLSLRATTLYRLYTFDVELGATDGVTGALGSPIRADGFFLPADYQTHSRFALASVTAPLTARLSTFASVRYASLSAPEFATQAELTLNASVSYRIGQFVLSLEDQLVSGGSTRFDFRVNTLFVRAVRQFGLR